MTTIYLIRHAEAEGNIFRRAHGWYDSSVTRNGLRQIEALKKRFENVPVDAVYASDLIRTCTTAGAVYRPKGLALHREPRFREVGMGVWEDVPFGQLAYDEPEKLLLFSKSPQRWAVEGSERYETFTGRFLQALDEVAQRHEGQSVAIFSHGMILQNVLGRLLYDGDTARLGHCENTGVSKLLYENGVYRAEYLFDSTHLPAEISTVGRQNWRQQGITKSNFRYRPAGPGDAEFLHALGYALQPDDRVLLAYAEQTPAGAVALRRADETTGGIVFLGLMPEFRGQGLAAQLLGCAVSAFRRDGLTELCLLQAPQGASARFFEDFCLLGSRVSLIPQVR